MRNGCRGRSGDRGRSGRVGRGRGRGIGRCRSRGRGKGRGRGRGRPRGSGSGRGRGRGTSTGIDARRKRRRNEDSDSEDDLNNEMPDDMDSQDDRSGDEKADDPMRGCHAILRKLSVSNRTDCEGSTRLGRMLLVHLLRYSSVADSIVVLFLADEEVSSVSRPRAKDGCARLL